MSVEIKAATEERLKEFEDDLLRVMGALNSGGSVVPAGTPGIAAGTAVMGPGHTWTGALSDRKAPIFCRKCGCYMIEEKWYYKQYHPENGLPMHKVASLKCKRSRWYHRFLKWIKHDRVKIEYTREGYSYFSDELPAPDDEWEVNNFIYED